MNASSCFFRFLARSRAHRRRGVFIAELLLTMPAFVVFLFAIVEFGFLFANLQLVSMASRVGADAAADASSFAAFPTEVSTVVEEHLKSAGIDEFAIRLEHNVGGSVAVLTHGTWTASCQPSTSLASPPVSGEKYVRVSVCVPMSELTANLLQVFGFDITDRQVSYTTVQRYQL